MIFLVRNRVASQDGTISSPGPALYETKLVLDVAMRACTKDINQGTLGLYGHCGYDHGSLRSNFFEELQYLRED